MTEIATEIAETEPKHDPSTAIGDEADTTFEPINRAYGSVFRPNRLSIGLVVPIESYVSSSVPTLDRHSERVRMAEELGFSAVWLRDVPFDVPSFGDAGQLHDPFVYLGYLAGSTERIALGVASIILPLRHPAHVAKAAASVDSLSNGRLLLGVASGDRPAEYPAFGVPYEDRGALFRSSFEYIRKMSETRPLFDSELGSTRGGIDMLPKPTAGKLPLLITGGSQQSPEWRARNGDGWMVYPRGLAVQEQVVRDYRARLRSAGRPDRPVMQPLYVDLAEDPAHPPEPIHLGFRAGVNPLVSYLESLERIGVNHVALNLRFGRSDTETTLQRLAEHVLPAFPTRISRSKDTD